MTGPSEAAVEAAAEAIAASDWSDDGTNEARAALTAAYPLIKADIEAALRAELAHVAKILDVRREVGSDPGLVAAWDETWAARIVRGEA